VFNRCKHGDSGSRRGRDRYGYATWFNRLTFGAIGRQNTPPTLQTFAALVTRWASAWRDRVVKRQTVDILDADGAAAGVAGAAHVLQAAPSRNLALARGLRPGGSVQNTETSP